MKSEKNAYATQNPLSIILFFIILCPQYKKYETYVDVYLYDSALVGSRLYRMACVGHPPLFTILENSGRDSSDGLFPVVLLRLATTDRQLFVACGAGAL